MQYFQESGANFAFTATVLLNEVLPLFVQRGIFSPKENSFLFHFGCLILIEPEIGCVTVIQPSLTLVFHL